jgi:hypothetical protein
MGVSSNQLFSTLLPDSSKSALGSWAVLGKIEEITREEFVHQLLQKNPSGYREMIRLLNEEIGSYSKGEPINSLDLSLRGILTAEDPALIPLYEAAVKALVKYDGSQRYMYAALIAASQYFENNADFNLSDRHVAGRTDGSTNMAPKQTSSMPLDPTVQVFRSTRYIGSFRAVMANYYMQSGAQFVRNLSAYAGAKAGDFLKINQTRNEFWDQFESGSIN